MSAAVSLARFVESGARALADACTGCGRCVEVCPVVPHAGIASVPAGDVVGGVTNFLTGGTLTDAASAWMSQCNGCGQCIPACPEGINPRRMLTLAQKRGAHLDGGVPEVFRKLARAVRLMASMQLAPEELSRVLRHRATRRAPVVFYLGCNALRTPNVLLDAMTVLDALEVDYEVTGGPASCCGIVHSRTEGELSAGEAMITSTVARFDAFGARRVLSWCPSCQLQLGESVHGYRPMRFDMEHVTGFLLEHREALAAKWATPIERRVLLHAHDGFGAFGRNVETLLDSIPGLDRVETVIESGYTCGAAGSDRSPGRKARDRERLFARVGETGVDTVVSLYHGCHRSLVADSIREEFEVVNFTALLVEALGESPHEDGYQRMLRIGDDAALAEQAQGYLTANGIDVDTDWLRDTLPDLFTMAEFRGGLECFGSRGADSAIAPANGSLPSSLDQTPP